MIVIGRVGHCDWASAVLVGMAKQTQMLSEAIPSIFKSLPKEFWGKSLGKCMNHLLNSKYTSYLI
jgi:hypothetical protein